MGPERSTGRFYVYALTDARPASGRRLRKSSGGPAAARRQTADRRLQAGARRLRAIDIGAVSAIVERVAASPDASDETLLEQHALVVRLAGRFEALLPVRFGAVFTREELTARIESSHDLVRRALDRVRGRVQMTVRLRGAAPDPVPRDASGTAWLVARAERARFLADNAARLRRAVAGLVDDERIDPGKGTLLGTVYHLISAVNVERYRSAMARIAPALAPVQVTLTGPWPVFAFVPDLDKASGRAHGR